MMTLTGNEILLLCDAIHLSRVFKAIPLIDPMPMPCLSLCIGVHYDAIAAAESDSASSSGDTTQFAASDDEKKQAAIALASELKSVRHTTRQITGADTHLYRDSGGKNKCVSVSSYSIRITIHHPLGAHSQIARAAASRLLWFVLASVVWQRRQFVDLAGCTLRCMVCDKAFLGQASTPIGLFCSLRSSRGRA
jgi:cytochrome c-type biogenesis protein CcmH/NrfF